MAQELVAHPVTGEPAVKVIHFTPDGEVIDYEVRTLHSLQAALDHAYEEAKEAAAHAKEVQRQADLLIREAQAKVDEAETRLSDCKSERTRGEAITANPRAYQGAEAASSPDPVDVSRTAANGFGLPR